MTLPRPCLDCGSLTEGSRCPECEPAFTREQSALRDRVRLSPKQRGYDAQWRRLSARARELQPWCSTCGTTDDLTTDHSPEAWARKAQGKAIRLQDVDVLCRSHNGSLGSSRPGSVRAET